MLSDVINKMLFLLKKYFEEMLIMISITHYHRKIKLHQGVKYKYRRSFLYKLSALDN